MNALYFTAGIPGPGGEVEDHGLFGELQVRATPAPGTLSLVGVSILGGLAVGGLKRWRAKTAPGHGAHRVVRGLAKAKSPPQQKGAGDAPVRSCSLTSLQPGFKTLRLIRHVRSFVLQLARAT